MSNLRFSVYDHKLVYDEDHLLNRQLIVLKDEYGNIVGWTNFHKYAINVNLKMYSFDHLRMYNIDHINTCCSSR